MVFNATFNNISVISWRLVLLMEATGVSEENHICCEKQVDTYISCGNKNDKIFIYNSLAHDGTQPFRFTYNT